MNIIYSIHMLLSLSRFNRFYHNNPQHFLSKICNLLIRYPPTVSRKLNMDSKQNANDFNADAKDAANAEAKGFDAFNAEANDADNAEAKDFNSFNADAQNAGNAEAKNSNAFNSEAKDAANAR